MSDTSRRRFLGRTVAAVAGGIALTRPRAARAEEAPQTQAAGVLERPTSFVEGNPLERMLADLRRALAKPVDQRKWVMVIDLQKCIGCKACTVSCNAENAEAIATVWRQVQVEYSIGKTQVVGQSCAECCVCRQGYDST